MVFAREPIAGQVKTRLIPALGAEGATRLYRRLLRIALDAATGVPGVRPELWCAGAPPDGGECARLAGRDGLDWYHQPAGNLGARMAEAFRSALSGCDRAVLIGSDCPGYSTDYLAAAFAGLADRDVVLGPAVDGGYVLIGLSRPAPALFTGIDWGTDRCLSDTRARLVALGLDWAELPTLSDIDRPEDLANAPMHLGNDNPLDRT